MSYFKASDDVIPLDEVDTHEQVILRGFSKNRWPIYEVRQPDGTYKLRCLDPEWTGA